MKFQDIIVPNFKISEYAKAAMLPPPQKLYSETKSKGICHEIDTSKAFIYKGFENQNQEWQGNNPTAPDFEVLFRDI